LADQSAERRPAAKAGPRLQPRPTPRAKHFRTHTSIARTVCSP
jgi:hypothetical protein